MRKNNIIKYIFIAVIISCSLIAFLWVITRLFHVNLSTSNEDAIILAFFGILATFVVVGNYTQVANIQQQMHESLQNVKNTCVERLNSVNTDVSNLKDGQSKMAELITSSKMAISHNGNSLKNTREFVLRLLLSPQKELLNNIFLGNEYKCEIKMQKGTIKNVIATLDENHNLIFKDESDKKKIYKSAIAINGNDCNMREMQKLISEYYTLDQHPMDGIYG